jgi:hypothetical protein
VAGTTTGDFHESGTVRVVGITTVDGVTGTVMMFEVGTETMWLDGTVDGRTETEITTTCGDDGMVTYKVDEMLLTSDFETTTGLDQVDGTVTSSGTTDDGSVVETGTTTWITGAEVGKMLVGIDDNGTDDGMIVVIAGAMTMVLLVYKV